MLWMAALTQDRSRLMKTGMLAGSVVITLAMLVQSCSRGSSYKEVKPVRGDLTAAVMVTGRVQPDNRIDIKPPLPGRAEKVLVREGDFVKKGQILLWMSSAQRVALIDSAKLIGPAEAAYWEKKNPPTPVFAHSDGLIIQRNIEPGQVFGESNAILVMSDIFVVEAPIDETDLARIENGQQASVVLDAYPNVEIPSKVYRISHEATTVENVISYRLEISFDETPEFVRVGMTALVRFEMEADRDALLVPSEALRADENEIYVFASAKNSSYPEKRKVKIGLTNGLQTEILEGLREDDRVYIPVPRSEAPRPKNLKTIIPL